MNHVKWPYFRCIAGDGTSAKRVAFLQVMVTPPKIDKGSIYSIHHYVSYVSWFCNVFAIFGLFVVHLSSIFHFLVLFSSISSSLWDPFCRSAISQVDRGLDARRTAGEHVAETVRLPWLSGIGGGTPMERRERLVSSK